jgi:tetratricopeptide (TPR) repeat protein
MEQGRPGEALTAFEAVLAVDPTCGMAAQGRAAALLRLGRTAEAEKAAEQAAQNHPTRPEPWVTLATARLLGQDLSGARAAALQAVKAAPDDIDAHLVHQQVLLRTGDLGAARSHLAALGNKLPDPVLACLTLGIEREAGGPISPSLQDRCVAAGPEIEGAVAARVPLGGPGGQYLARIATAVDLLNRKDFAAAENAADQVLKSNPEEADAWMVRGLAREGKGDRAGAIQDLRKAVASGDHARAHADGTLTGVLRASHAQATEAQRARAAGHLLTLLTREGRLDEAMSLDPQLQARFGEAPELLAGRAQLAWARGDKALAWRLLDTAKGGNAPEVWEAITELELADPDSTPATIRTFIRAGSTPVVLYNTMVGHQKAGRAHLCASLPDEGRSHDPRVGRLAWQCAVESGDLELAGKWRATIGDEVSRTAPATVYNHALKLRTAGDAAAAINVLGGLLEDPPDSPETRDALLQLGVILSVETGDLDGAVRLARLPTAPPQARLQAAQGLWSGGRKGEVGALVGGLCPTLGGEERALCEDLQRRAAGL